MGDQRLRAPHYFNRAWIAPIFFGASGYIVAERAHLPGSIGGGKNAFGVFGGKFGMAYQLYDDFQSIWGVPEKTGKKRAGDIYERKKTLPVIYARKHLADADGKHLESLYDRNGELGEAMVDDVLSLLAHTDARGVLERRANQYKKESVEALADTDLPSATKMLLEQVARELVPDSIAEPG